MMICITTSDDREFKNQFTEFLQKNLPKEEDITEAKQVKPKGAKKKRVRKAKANLEDFIYDKKTKA